MGGKNSKSKGAPTEDAGSHGGSGHWAISDLFKSFHFLSSGEVNEWLGSTSHSGKVGLTTRYVVKEESVEQFIVLIKELDTPKFLELFAGASVDIFADVKESNVFWSLGSADNPEAWLKYLDDEKTVKFNETTVVMLEGPPECVIYKSL